jgi:hypothetical protein
MDPAQELQIVEEMIAVVGMITLRKIEDDIRIEVMIEIESKNYAETRGMNLHRAKRSRAPNEVPAIQIMIQIAIVIVDGEKKRVVVVEVVVGVGIGIGIGIETITEVTDDTRVNT